MVPLVSRMHLFEIDDQTWFPPYLRKHVQGALTMTWTSYVPPLQHTSPARLVSEIIPRQLAAVDATQQASPPTPADRATASREAGLACCRDYTFVDFCAGGGGPTPKIESEINKDASGSSSRLSNGTTAKGNGMPASIPEEQEQQKTEPVQFVLTDLFPHVEAWEGHASRSANVSFERDSVDASAVPAELVQKFRMLGVKKGGKQKKLFRLFNLAYHHFDDDLARRILKDTIENSDAFGIFELQSRTVSSVFTMLFFGIGCLLFAPVFAWKQRSFGVLLFTYLIPVLPFVILFDGIISSLRTRTPEEVEALLRTCGAPQEEILKWEIRSGCERHMWPCGYLDWIVAVKVRQ